MKARTLLTLLLKITLIFLLLLTSCATPTPQPATVEPPTLTGTPIATTASPPSPVVTTHPTTEAPPPAIVTPTTPPAIGATSLNCELTKDAIELNQPGRITAGPFFINDQVILSGPVEKVEQAALKLADSLAPLIVCTLSLPDNFVATLQNEMDYPLHASEEALAFGTTLSKIKPAAWMEMNLYRLKEGVNLQAVFEGLIDFPEVFADPNYLVGDSARSSCGEPNGTAGQPFSVAGSPFSVAGSPYGGAAIPATLEAFWGQWAFNHLSISNTGVSLPEQAGYGARIAIFDTSPYQLETGITTALVTETVISPPLRMIVHHPWDLFAIPTSSIASPTVDISGHGPFVASLAHAVAPGSQIDLYRVLDQHGCGDLFHLNMAMLDFITSRLNEGTWRIHAANPAVINLSLGILKPSQVTEDEDITKEKIDEAVKRARQIVQSRGNSIASLAIITNLAYRAGIVVVAAAGNDSLPDTPPLPMNLPAAYPSVIGVAASTVKGSRACYSNVGDVIAPGGEADRGIDRVSRQAICVPGTKKCLGDAGSPGSCEYGVVGFFKPLDPVESDFAYWVGTSFATPLISGKAAVQYANESNIRQVYLDMLAMFPYPSP